MQHQPTPDPIHNPWQITHCHTAYENPWIRILHHDVINPSGNAGIYGVVDFKNHAVGIIPIDDNGHTWIVGQFRFPTNSYEWEIPEGGANHNEDPTLCATRELQEETGLQARSLTPILHLHLSNSTTNERSTTYLATGITQGTPNPEETELLHIRHLPFTDVVNMVLNGMISDALSVASILQLHTMASTGKLSLPGYP